MGVNCVLNREQAMDSSVQAIGKSKVLLIPIDSLYLEVNRQQDFENKLYF